MFCEKCGSPLEVNAKFCTACGAVVNSVDNGQPNQPFDDTIQQTQTFINTEDQSNNGLNNNGFNNFQQPAAKPAKSKAPVVVGVIVLLIAALVGGYFTFGKTLFSKLSAKKDPVKRTMTSLTNIGTAKAVDFETTLKLKLEGDASSGVLVKDIVEGIAVKVKGKYVKENNQGDYNLSVVYKNQPIVNLSIYADKEMMIITSDELLEQPLYANIKELQGLMGEGMTTATMDVEKYEAVGKELAKNEEYKNLSKEYKEFFEVILKEFIVQGEGAEVAVIENGKERTVKADELTMNINSQFLQKVAIGLMEKVSEDKKLKPFLLDAMQKFYDVAKENGDFEKFGMDEEEFSTAMDEMETGWDEAMTEMKTAMAEAKEQLAAINFNSTATFRIDSDNRLRQLVYEIEGGELIGEAMGMPGLSASVVIDTIFNAYDGDVKVVKPSTDGGVNLAEMDEYELTSLMGDLQEKLQNIIMSNFGGM